MTRNEGGVRGRAAPLLAAIMLCAAVLRFGFWSRDSGAYMRSHDPEEGYYEQGVGLLSQGVFSFSPAAAGPKDWRGPVYPSFLALTETATRTPSASHPRLALALLSLLGVGFIFWLGSRIAGPWAGAAGAFLMAIDAGQILSASSLNIHAFYGLILLALAGAAALWVESPTPLRGVVLGAAFGATLLTRSSHFLAFPAVLLLGVRAKDGLAAHLKRWSFPVLALCAALLPWTVRNAAQFGVFEPFDLASSAVNLYAASTGALRSASVEEAAAAAAKEDPAIAGLYARRSAAMFPRLKALALARIARAPGGYALSCAKRLRLLFGRWWFALAAALFAGLARRTRACWAALAVAASLGAYALIATQEAYAEAARPLLALLLGVAAAEAARLGGARVPPPASNAAAGRAFAWALAAAFALVLAASFAFIAREAYVTRRGGSNGPPPAAGTRAELLLRDIARRDPTGLNEMAYARFLLSAGRTEEACAAFSGAARFQEVRFEALERRAECAFASRKPADAEEALTRYIALLGRPLPSQPRGGLEIGRERLSPVELRTQRELLERSSAGAADPRLLEPVRESAELAELLTARAFARWTGRDPRGASSDFLRALSLDAWSACHPSESLVDPGGMPPAYFDGCVKRLPRDAELWADRGVSLWQAGRAAEARSSFRAALKEDPGSLTAALSLEFALGGEKGEAARVLRAALAASREPADSPLRLRAKADYDALAEKPAGEARQKKSP